MPLDPPVRWRLVLGKSHALVKQTDTGSARDVINDFLFPTPYRGPASAPTADEAIDWTEDGILQLLDAGLAAGAKAVSTFDPIIYLAPSLVAYTGGPAAQTVTATITAAGVVGKIGDQTTTVTAAVTTAGVVAKFGAATSTATVTTTTAGVVGKVGDSTSTVTATITAAGVVAKFGDASLTVTATTTAAGTATGSSLTGDVTQTITASTTAAGTVARFGAATSTVTATVTAAGVVNRIGAATSTTTATTTAAGTVAKFGAATVAPTVTITASGFVGVAGGATVTGVTVTVTAAGTVDSPAKTGGTSTTFTVAITADGLLVTGQRTYFSAVPQDFKRGRRYGTQDSWWLPQTVGVTVWRKDGVWYSKSSPPSWETDGADRLYLGGRTYEITPSEQAELVSAGFGAGVYTS